MKIELHKFVKLYDFNENDIPCVIGIQRGNTIFTKRYAHISDLLGENNTLLKMLVSDFYVLGNHLMISVRG